jgi:putative SOS response-associated peptidase YedK
MCGRFAFYSPREAMIDVFELPPDTPAVQPRWNLAPSQLVATVRAAPGGTRELAMLHWGLVPSWAKERSIGQRLINARADTLAAKPSFRSAFRRRRCLVLADGYYEWRAGAPDGGAKQPYFIRPEHGGPIGMAGLWERWRDPASGEPFESCVIVTTDASEALRRIHERMPVVIPRAQFAAWLDPANEDVATLQRLLAPASAAPLVATPVSRRVNSPKNEGPELIEPEPRVE